MSKNSIITTHDCLTYIAVWLDCDIDKCDAAIVEGRECSPEEIGIYNKDEIENFIIEELGVVPKWDYHLLLIGFNHNYDVDVNNMIRVTLKDLFGKEEKLKQLMDKFSIQVTLEIAPYIVYDDNKPNQILSLDKDIIEFLYKSKIDLNLDYSVI